MQIESAFWRSRLMAMLGCVVLAGVVRESVEAKDQSPIVAFRSAKDDIKTPDVDKSAVRKADGEDFGTKQSHALHRISSIMVDVQGRLRSQNTSQETLTLQRTIIDGLSKLIDDQSQSTSQQKGGTNQVQRPNPADGKRPGSVNGRGAAPSGTGSMSSTNLLLKQIWGTLPDQIRQQVETPLHEEFLPQYDDLIQDYFKRLANENSK